MRGSQHTFSLRNKENYLRLIPNTPSYLELWNIFSCFFQHTKMLQAGGQVEHLLPKLSNGCGHLTLTCDLSPLSSGQPVNQMNQLYSVFFYIRTMTIYGMMTFAL